MSKNMAGKKNANRTLARQAAVQVLYQSEMTACDVEDILNNNVVILEETGLDSYARMLLHGVAQNKEAIDQQISAVSQNWALDRMPVVDRSVLRLAVYEMTRVDTVPVSVSINEAVELAKAFGGEDDSHRFVNGILGRIAKSMEAQAAEAPAQEEAPVAEETAEVAENSAE